MASTETWGCPFPSTHHTHKHAHICISIHVIHTEKNSNTQSSILVSSPLPYYNLSN